MSQDPFERVQVLLSETRVNPLALLLDLASALPDSLVARAISLVENASDTPLRAFVIYELAKRLPNRSDRIELTSRYFPPASTSVDQVSVPEGKEAKRLIAKLTELQRFEVFDQLFVKLETGKSPSERFKRSRRPPETKSVEDDFGGGFESADPPENFGGGGATSFHGFDGVDAGFESTGGAQSAGGALDDGFEAVTPAPQPTPQPASGISEETSKRPDLVSLGFSHKDVADRKVQKTEPLQRGQSYYFWLMIGKEADEAAIGKPAEIDLTLVPAEAVLTVAIFGFENELAITPGQDIGELKIEENGKVRVRRQPVDNESILLSTKADTDFLERYLLFPITVPDNEATHRLRCNIYCGQVLVQSYVVSANVKSTSEPVSEGCAQQLDYVLSQSLRADHLNTINKEPHLLSLMVNDNGNGKHGFRFFGNDGAEFKDDAQIDGQQLKDFLYQARAALRRVAWGNEDEWDGKTGSYRYLKEKFDEKTLARDLAYLANAGYSIYYGFSQHLQKDPDELEALLANSGLIQIALKLSPRAVLPAAVVYDYAWNPQLFMPFDKTDFKLCPSFSKALKEARNGGPPLEECVCFHGGCELKQMMLAKPGQSFPIICPSGFWGYRHLLGLPLTLDGINKDIPPVIEYKDSLQMFACVSTDGDFVERDPHLQRLSKVEGLKFERDDAYDPFVNRLRSSDVPHMLYFYCHGGVKFGTSHPFLQVGMKEERKDEINPPNWRFQRIKWKGPHPLVFINGCHTTSLNPEVTLDFVTAFVQTSGASGVIGTEITIFEPLAVKFAEECLKRFMGAPPFEEKMPIGKAIRGARLELLRQGNPLGLVYIPYAVASLRLEEKK